MIVIVMGNHHKQALLKLINCITNTNSVQTTNRLGSAINVLQMDSMIFVSLKQIIKVYESVVNKGIKIDENEDSSVEPNNELNNVSNNEINDENEAKTCVHSWLVSNYDCHQLIDNLFCNQWHQSLHCFNAMDSMQLNSSEDQLWTICLLVLNIMYKMRNCLTEHKMMLELGWICLSELDSTLTQFKPNYNQILIVLQNALKEEKKDNKIDIEECNQLTQEVKRLRQKIIELQRNIIKINKEKQVLGKRENISKNIGLRKQTKSSVKRAQNMGEDDDEDDDPLRDLDTSHKRKRNAQIIGSIGSMGSMGSFNCEMCNKPFGSSYRLQRHMYSHTGQRPYSCLWPACNRQFNDNYHLKRHMLSHTGEKPYVCQSADCSKRFARPEDLRTHQKTHWKQSEQLIDRQMDFESNQSLENNELTFIQ